MVLHIIREHVIPFTNGLNLSIKTIEIPLGIFITFFKSFEIFNLTNHLRVLSELNIYIYIYKMSVFENIYKNNFWGFGSGTGSVPINNLPYIDFLQKFINEHDDIKTVLDIGCGDWQISEVVDWGQKKYLGIDVVDNVIQKNIKKYSNDKIQFKVLNLFEEDIPESDLIIIKDVFQHLSFDNIRKILNKLDNSKFKYVIISGDVNYLTNYDIHDGSYRTLNVNIEPFNDKTFEIVTSYCERSIIIAYSLGLLWLTMCLYYYKLDFRYLALFMLISIVIFVFLVPKKTIFLKKNYTKLNKP
jgi:SAM-dependent methyltransferase